MSKKKIQTAINLTWQIITGYVHGSFNFCQQFTINIDIISSTVIKALQNMTEIPEILIVNVLGASNQQQIFFSIL